MEIISALIFFIAIAAIYISLYVLNHRTVIPDGIENLSQKCGSCSVQGCAARSKEEIRK